MGWFFDGLDMHLYLLVAAPFVAELLGGISQQDARVKSISSWVQAAFLVGWALGGGFFGRIGDRLGRSRALSLTILTYALFTGLTFFARTWPQLLVCRFVAALGIGGEWAVGASLLSETWPSHWRPWLAAVLQTAVNVGVLFACLTTFLLAASHPRYVFLVGIVPALVVFWIRRSVPETPEWLEARTAAGHRPAAAPATASSASSAPATDYHGEVLIEPPRVRQLFQGSLRRTTVLTILVCACSLTAWWAFMFWSPQHLRDLPELANWSAANRARLVSANFFTVIGISIAGNFFAGWLAKRMGYRRAIAVMFVGFFAAMVGTYAVPRHYLALMLWTPWIGFFSGVFALFTMYVPGLFPTLLRTTGAGFSYNIGRLAAAAGTVIFGLFAHVGDFRTALLCDSVLLLPAIAFALRLPDLDTPT